MCPASKTPKNNVHKIHKFTVLYNNQKQFSTAFDFYNSLKRSWIFSYLHKNNVQKKPNYLIYPVLRSATLSLHFIVYVTKILHLMENVLFVFNKSLHTWKLFSMNFYPYDDIILAWTFFLKKLSSERKNVVWTFFLKKLSSVCFTEMEEEVDPQLGKTDNIKYSTF